MKKEIGAKEEMKCCGVFANISITHIPSKNETDLAANLTRTVKIIKLFSSQSARWFFIIDCKMFVYCC